jgi:ParB family transcriptional regulator, chromosome partitioning protein
MTMSNYTIIEINVNQIISNDGIYLADRIYHDLIESIRSKGILIPLIVTRRNDYYIIGSGKLRYRVARLLNFPTVPCIVVDLTDEQIKELRISESYKRVELTDEDRIKYLQRLSREGIAVDLKTKRIMTDKDIDKLIVPSKMHQLLDKAEYRKTLLRLKEVNNLSNEELAEKLGKPVGWLERYLND